MPVRSSACALLGVRDLRVCYSAGAESRTAVNGISFEVRAGEIAGMQGRSGCGKTTTALAILKLLPRDARVNGSVLFEGKDLLKLSESELRAIRGKQISIIYQEPTLALNPVMCVGDQIAELLRAHSSVSSKQRRDEAEQMLERIQLDPCRYYRAYPHELSGGERHRIVLAQALVCRPALVIADEPTAGLDPALKMQILDLIRGLRQDLGTAFLLISHDHAVTSEFPDRIIEMPNNTERATAPVCVEAVSRRGTRAVAPNSALMSVRNLSKWYSPRGLFSGKRREKHALDCVDLTLPAGALVGLVGSSGCGKSTLARCLSLLEDADEGEIRFKGKDLRALTQRELRAYRPRLQYVSQDPAAALNPRLTASAAIGEPLLIQGIGDKQERSRRARELMTQVGLDPLFADRSCHEFSGGQKHRIAIARALALEPQLLIFDESLSGLDAETRRGILTLLYELKQTLGITQVLISHDLDLVSAVADSVAVMLRGRIVEHLPGDRLPANREHWSTERLMHAESACDLMSMESE
ncbi:MAG TPA: ABC transporter ATP-binding protein [Terriglobales bacterium]|nr:ABC transporter ATP-binding protein [Terriglobales bacterium]